MIPISVLLVAFSLSEVNSKFDCRFCWFGPPGELTGYADTNGWTGWCKNEKSHHSLASVWTYGFIQVVSSSENGTAVHDAMMPGHLRTDSPQNHHHEIWLRNMVRELCKVSRYQMPFRWNWWRLPSKFWWVYCSYCKYIPRVAQDLSNSVSFIGSKDE